MPVVPSPWTAVNGLVRELGLLRAQASGLKAGRWKADVADRMEILIATAAKAVDATIDAPEDERLLLLACEAIIVARDGMENCSDPPRSPSRGPGTASDLRHRAARLRSNIATSDHA